MNLLIHMAKTKGRCKMIIYRPHRELLMEAMEEVKEFDNEEEMKKYIANDLRGCLEIGDIIIDAEKYSDARTGWQDTRYVCTKRFGDQDYIKLYGCAQCIGMCATQYK